MRMTEFGQRFLRGAVFTLCLLLVLGCFGTTIGGTAQGSSKKKPAPSYYDFGDVLVPKELKVIKKSSFVYTTGNLSAGVLALKGRVEMNSLTQFFEVNMAKDGWTMVSAFKSPRTILMFHKENRWCVINITEKTMETMVEIWVAPAKDSDVQGLSK